MQEGPQADQLSSFTLLPSVGSSVFSSSVLLTPTTCSTGKPPQSKVFPNALFQSHFQRKEASHYAPTQAEKKEEGKGKPSTHFTPVSVDIGEGCATGILLSAGEKHPLKTVVGFGPSNFS